MRLITLAPILALTIAAPLAAEEVLTAGTLRDACMDGSEPSKAACRYFILGTVRGYALARGSAMSNGQFIESPSESACVPANATDGEIVLRVLPILLAALGGYPGDANLPAAGYIAAIAHRAFPCP